MNLLLTIIGMGVVTFLIRLSFIELSQYLTLSPAVHRALRYVPVAVLSAIILPEMLQPSGELMLSFGNPRLLAGLVAMIVAWRTENAIWTVGIGMGTLWLFQWAL